LTDGVEPLLCLAPGEEDKPTTGFDQRHVRGFETHLEGLLPRGWLGEAKGGADDPCRQVGLLLQLLLTPVGA
jgi:hypothetical protein